MLQNYEHEKVCRQTKKYDIASADVGSSIPKITKN